MLSPFPRKICLPRHHLVVSLFFFLFELFVYHYVSQDTHRFTEEPHKVGLTQKVKSELREKTIKKTFGAGGRTRLHIMMIGIIRGHFLDY